MNPEEINLKNKVELLPIIAQKKATPRQKFQNVMKNPCLL